jgi:O-acetyl-ADP-ribose deacetylase (regulator of RNase III)
VTSSAPVWRPPRVRVVLGTLGVLDDQLLADHAVDAVVVPVRAARRRPVGSAVVLPGVAAPRTIEVVGPVYSPAVNREHQLSAAYRAALAAADSIHARRIAVPTELTPAPWPVDPAIRVALGTLASTQTAVHEVLVVTVTAAGLEAWTERLARR